MRYDLLLGMKPDPIKAPYWSKEYARLSLRDRRKLAQANGGCSNCVGARPARPGKLTCEVCSQRGTQGKQKSRTRQKVRAILGLEQKDPS